MLYFVSKLLQAGGLALMGAGFLLNYPKLLPYKVFLVSVLLFGVGWGLQAYLNRQ